MEIKCPNCNSISTEKVVPNQGTSYVVTQIDQNQNPPSFLASTGIPVDLTMCRTCGNIQIFKAGLVK
jgi:hypothetical protein